MFLCVPHSESSEDEDGGKFEGLSVYSAGRRPSPHEFEFEESVPEDAAAEGERGVVASAAALPAEAGFSGAL